MRSYKEKVGDITHLFESGEFKYILHGCNCHKSMSGGLAKILSTKYPEVSLVDKTSPLSIDDRKGKCTYTQPLESCKGGIVVNCYTQFYPGPDFRMNYLESCIQELNETLPQNTHVGIPQIGCGIGGGNWKEVKQTILKQLRPDINIVFVYLNKPDTRI